MMIVWEFLCNECLEMLSKWFDCWFAESDSRDFSCTTNIGREYGASCYNGFNHGGWESFLEARIDENIDIWIKTAYNPGVLLGS